MISLEYKRTASEVSTNASSCFKPLILLMEIFDLKWSQAFQDFELKHHRHLSGSGSEAGAPGVKDDRPVCGLIPLICLHAQPPSFAIIILQTLDPVWWSDLPVLYSHFTLSHQIAFLNQCLGHIWSLRITCASLAGWRKHVDLLYVLCYVFQFLIGTQPSHLLFYLQEWHPGTGRSPKSAEPPAHLQLVTSWVLVSLAVP